MSFIYGRLVFEYFASENIFKTTKFDFCSFPTFPMNLLNHIGKFLNFHKQILSLLLLKTEHFQVTSFKPDEPEQEARKFVAIS